MIFSFLYIKIIVKQASNWDLENIISPVCPTKLNDLLNRAGYDKDKQEFLVAGFTHGFELQYEGNLKSCRRFAPNLKLRVGNKFELWNKVMTEVELGRFAGPFKEPPFDFFVQSPIGLVP